MDNGAKYMWKYLLEHGVVISEWNYYGCSYVSSDKKASRCNQLMGTVGIDWSKTKPVDQDREYRFVGTYVDADPVPVLTGTLVLNNGEKYNWGLVLENAPSIMELIADILPDPFEEK